MITPSHRDLGTLRGPLLVFGGVYSNLEALRALRQQATELGIPPENVICTGDTPGYCADPAACLQELAEWGCPAIAGNVEINLREGIDDCGCNFADGSRCDLFARRWYAYARAAIGPAEVTVMEALPRSLSFTYASRRVHVLHGSADHESEFIWPSTEWETKSRSFTATVADVILAGHSGLPFVDTEGEKLWVNAGAVGMPANDGTPRTWFAVLDDRTGDVAVTFHALDYDVRSAKEKMLARRDQLPLSYAATLTTGIWDNTEIMPPEEAAREGMAFDPVHLAFPAPRRPNPASPPTDNRQPKAMNPYSDPKDLRTFGKITEWQAEMGGKFFEW